MAHVLSLKLTTRTGRIGGASGNARLELGRGKPLSLNAMNTEVRKKLNQAVAASKPGSWVKVSGTLSKGGGRTTLWVNDFAPALQKK